MKRIAWLVILVIFTYTRVIESKFIDNEVHEFGIDFYENEAFREINLADNEMIGEAFETSQYELRFKTQQTYKGLPIFGATLVVQQDADNPKETIPISGKWYDKTDIDQLVPSIHPQIDQQDALNIALTALNIKNHLH